MISVGSEVQILPGPPQAMPLGIAKNAAYPAFSLLPFLLPSLRWTRVTDSDGGVAQLGEHLLCKQGVIGSIPFTSTKSPWIWCKISPYRDFVFLAFLVFACLSERARMGRAAPASHRRREVIHSMPLALSLPAEGRAPGLVDAPTFGACAL